MQPPCCTLLHKWTELSPPIAIQEDENRPYTCEPQSGHLRTSPSCNSESAAFAVEEGTMTSSAPHPHYPASGSRADQLLQGKGADAAKGISVYGLQWY